MKSAPSPSPEADLLAAIERTIETAGLPQLVALVGGLERLKAIIWLRLVNATIARATPPATEPVEDLRHLTPQQVAEILNLKAAYVHELCRTGRMPATKSGKYWMIPVAGFDPSTTGRFSGVHRGPVQSLNPRGDVRPPSLMGPAGRPRRSLMT